MSRHGWVKPLPSGAVARCGGPGMCAHCKAERIVNRGCPTSSSGRCFHCGALKSPARFEHKDDCIWPPFEEAFS